MPKKESETTGVPRSFYLEKEVSDKIDKWARELERVPSWIANKLLKQALVCPKWKWPGMREEE